MHSSAVSAQATMEGPVSEATSPARRYALAIDIPRCAGCQTCTAVCKNEFGLMAGVHRNWVEYIAEGTFPYQGQLPVPRTCNHCLQPACAEVCAPQAIRKREKDGVVAIDKLACDGCGACVEACTYKAIHIHPLNGKADKCNFCLHRVNQGLSPVCVQGCLQKARIFGDLNDPNSDLSRLLASRRSVSPRALNGSATNLFYLL